MKTSAQRSRGETAAGLLVAGCALGLVLTILVFYPGFMSSDSLDQYSEALSGQYQDAHPAAMAFLWSLVSRIHPGPFPMLIFQAVTFWAGLFLWGLYLIRNGSLGFGAAIPLVGFLPPVFGLLGIIWKDEQMASSFVLATSLLAWSRAPSDGKFGRKQAAALTLSLAALLYGSLVRHNSIAAWVSLLPGYALALEASMPRFPRRWLGRAGLSVALGALLLLAEPALNRSLHVKRTHLGQYIELYDLAGIYAFGGTPDFPSYISGDPHFSLQKVRQAYHSYSLSPLFWNRSPKTGSFDVTEDPDKLSALNRAWISSSLKNPGPLLRHKLTLFSTLIGLHPDRDTLVWGIDPHNDLRLSAEPSSFSVSVHDLIVSLTGTGFFAPAMWLYFSAGGWVFAYLLRRRDPTRQAIMAPCLALLASATLYTLSYTAALPAIDFRYVYWSVIATAIGLVLLASEVAHHRKNQRRESNV